jgi:hypothetical protein
MRHYDAQIVDIVKFAFTAYAAIVGASLALYRYGLDKGADFRAPATAIVLVGLPLGVTLLALVTRNRSYFVLVTRYINEHRDFFLKGKPLGFPNATGMFTNRGKPPYFNWRSSQALLLCSLALLNAALIGVGLYLVFEDIATKWYCIGIGASALLLLQLAVAIAYLGAPDGKSAGRAIFGQD